MAQTIMLAQENRLEKHIVGREITMERDNDMTTIADRHRFRSFECEVKNEQIEAVKQNARISAQDG